LTDADNEELRQRNRERIFFIMATKLADGFDK
jgi:hypothetical protein